MIGLNEVKRLLEELDVVPRKSKGQNFLIDKGSIEKAIAFSDIQSTESVVEVGPGLGALTEHLVHRAKSFFAIDIEQTFIDRLRQCFPALSADRLICEDVREVDLKQLGFAAERRVVVVSNVPYSLSSEMVLWLLGHYQSVQRATLLLQREFAERVAAEPGSKDYGSLSVLTALYADVRLGPKVSGSCFFPSAEVESRFVELRMLQAPRYEVPSREHFERIVRASFGKRRKTLLNSLASSNNCGSKGELEELLRGAGFDPGRRGETLSLSEFVKLTNLIPLPKQ